MTQLNARPTKDRVRANRQAKAKAAREAARRADRRRALLLRVSLAVVVLAVLVGIATVVVTAIQPRAVALPAPQPASGTAMPPWSVPQNPSAGIESAGLSVSPMTSSGAHFHPHLDILVDGKAVPVPANIGIDATTGAMSELHTHDTSGVVHIESPAKDDRYTLGQLFVEWDVRLDRTHLGGLVSSGERTIAAYVDGKRFRGDPARIELLPHRQIALLYGTPKQQVDPPARYDFPAGE